MSLPCPSCKVDLVMSDRHGVEIDYCPKCRGVWLDRGELDKIIERADGGPRAASQQTAPSQAGSLNQAGLLNQGLFGDPAVPRDPARDAQPPGQYRDQRRGDDDDDDRYRGHKHGKRKNWLSEIFD